MPLSPVSTRARSSPFPRCRTPPTGKPSKRRAAHSALICHTPNLPRATASALPSDGASRRRWFGCQLPQPALRLGEDVLGSRAAIAGAALDRVLDAEHGIDRIRDLRLDAAHLLEVQFFE